MAYLECHDSWLLPTGPEVPGHFTVNVIELVSKGQRWEWKSLHEQHFQHYSDVPCLEENAGLPLESAGPRQAGPSPERPLAHMVSW